MKKTDLLVDLAALTTIQKASLDKLCAQAHKCLCHSVQEANIDGDDTVRIDIGLGNLFIKFNSEEIKYRFEPSYKLEEYLTSTLSTGISPIIEDVEDSLISKINNAYKELF